MDTILAIMLIATPIVLGLTQGVKQMLVHSLINESRIAFPVSLILGVIVCFMLVLADVTEASYRESLLAGVLSGMSASGLYSGQKALRE